MASEEHKTLAQFLKDVHTSLRENSLCVGHESAWLEHCQNKDILHTYSQCMEKLATTYWEGRSLDKLGSTTSRIKWAADFCYAYFINKLYDSYSIKEIEIGIKIDVTIKNSSNFSNILRLLDVGSCYNPFKAFEYFDVLALDLCPANDTVMQCDFLNVLVGPDIIIKNGIVEQLKESGFDVITFCFLLEYIPSSELRIKACENAYNVLKYGGLLIIITPDSKHVGANSKLMKCWRYTLACLGFSRIKYEKYKHMHCMAFRKSLHKDVAVRWAKLHKESFMEFNINIPQDFKPIKNKPVPISNITASVEDFIELPFFNNSESANNLF